MMTVSLMKYFHFELSLFLYDCRLSVYRKTGELTIPGFLLAKHPYSSVPVPSQSNFSHQSHVLNHKLSTPFIRMGVRPSALS